MTTHFNNLARIPLSNIEFGTPGSKNRNSASFNMVPIQLIFYTAANLESVNLLSRAFV